jgi:phosphoglycolate phosphatase
MSDVRLLHPWSGRPVRALLFDLDGTLVDSAPDIAVAVNTVMVADGIAPLSVPVVRSLIGEGVRRLVEKAYALQGSHLEGHTLDERTETFEALYASAIAVHTRAYPGVETGLREMREMGFKTAVVSNKLQHLTDQLLAELGLVGVLDYVCGARENLPKKPAPDMLLHTLEHLHVDVAEALFIGDSIADVRAANAGGLPCVLIGGGYTETPVAELGAWKTVSDFAGLWSALGVVAGDD